MSRDDGGVAFPSKIVNASEKDAIGCNGDVIPAGSVTFYGGISTRDYFAAKAMQAIVSTVPHLCAVRAADVAGEAYEYADAMLLERAK